MSRSFEHMCAGFILTAQEIALLNSQNSSLAQLAPQLISLKDRNLTSLSHCFIPIIPRRDSVTAVRGEEGVKLTDHKYASSPKAGRDAKLNLS